MFESYANGMTLEQISEELQARGFTTLRGKEKLTATTISRNLRNEIYKGDRQIQKAPHIDMLTHKPEKGGEYKSYYVEQDHEGIVSVELWDEVQKALAEQRNVFANKNSHYLRGKVVCANCGEYFMRTTRKKKTGKYKKMDMQRAFGIQRVQESADVGRRPAGPYRKEAGGFGQRNM